MAESLSLTDLEQIAKILAKVFRDEPEKITWWLLTENRHLGESTPAKLFLRGRSKKLLEIMQDMTEGNLAREPHRQD